MLRKFLTFSDCLRKQQGGIFLGICALVSVGVGGCATLERLPAVSYAQAKQTDMLDIPGARVYVSEKERILDIALKANQRLI